MPGKVVHILVNAGDRVEVGQGLFVVDMVQNEIRSPRRRDYSNAGQEARRLTPAKFLPGWSRQELLLGVESF
jgi:multidrug efflux pump subunit AcrA (membrane-fusion protein)